MIPDITPKYTRVEYTRMFLVPAPTRLDAATSAVIDDRYLTGTRVRLRKMTRPDGTTLHTLSRQHDGDGGLALDVADLTAIEHTVFSQFEANVMRTRRHTVAHGNHELAIDVFEGALDGLVLCEVSAAIEDEIADFTPPRWATVEVTGDPFFSGANLAFTTPEQLRARLTRA